MDGSIGGKANLALPPTSYRPLSSFIGGNNLSFAHEPVAASFHASRISLQCEDMRHQLWLNKTSLIFLPVELNIPTQTFQLFWKRQACFSFSKMILPYLLTWAYDMSFIHRRIAPYRYTNPCVGESRSTLWVHTCVVLVLVL